MENLKHTKDWQLTPMLNVCDSEGKMLFSSQANFSHEQTKEYMKLAASAPDLLEALKGLLKRVELYNDRKNQSLTWDEIQISQNAINKATK